MPTTDDARDVERMALAAQRLADAPEPTTRRGRLSAWLGVVAGALYLVAPTAGIFELIPDPIPIVGNLDEAGATGLVILGIQYLRRARREREEARPG